MKKKRSKIKALEDPKKRAEIEMLKQKFLKGAGEEIAKMEKMKKAVGNLILNGASPQELLKWGIEAGHDEEFVRRTLSEALPHALDGLTMLPKPDKDQEKGQQ